MEKTLLVGLGGYPGSVLRHGLGGMVVRLEAGWTFPRSATRRSSSCATVGGRPPRSRPPRNSRWASAASGPATPWRGSCEVTR